MHVSDPLWNALPLELLLVMTVDSPLDAQELQPTPWFSTCKVRIDNGSVKTKAKATHNHSSLTQLTFKLGL